MGGPSGLWGPRVPLFHTQINTRNPRAERSRQMGPVIDFLYRASYRDEFLCKIVLCFHVRCHFPEAIAGIFTSHTATTGIYFNANHMDSQHGRGFFPSLTLFQSLNFIIRKPFLQPLSLSLRHLPKLDFVDQGIQYRKLMTVVEM